MSIKYDLLGEQFVPGNLKHALQVYRFFYYPPEKDYPSSKLWLYFDRKEGQKYLGIKSLCFKSIENHLNFIINNIIVELHWIEQQGFRPETVESRLYRQELLNAMFRNLRKRVDKKLEEGLICQKIQN